MPSVPAMTPAATAPPTSATSSLPTGSSAPSASRPKTAYTPWFATADVKLDETLARSTARILVPLGKRERGRERAPPDGARRLHGDLVGPAGRPALADPAVPRHLLRPRRLRPRAERRHRDAVRPLDLREDGRRARQLERRCREPVAVEREGERRERVVE